MTDADKLMHPQHFGTDPTDIRIRIPYGLIRKFGLDCRITFVSKFSVCGGLRSLSAHVITVIIITDFINYTT